jgi:hypothetical protein
MRLVCGAVIRLYVAIRLFFAHRGKCSEIAKRTPLKCIYSRICKRVRLGQKCRWPPALRQQHVYSRHGGGEIVDAPGMRSQRPAQRVVTRLGARVEGATPNIRWK